MIEIHFLETRNPLTGTLTNSKDLDEMLLKAVFHQGLQKRSSEKLIQYCLEIITCDPSVYTMDHRKLIV